jgi:hypothetical protein
MKETSPLVPLKSYLLRIMSPGTTEDVIEDFVSDLPFGSVAVGDILDLQQYRRAISDTESVLRVVGVEHQLLQGKDGRLTHNIRVFTELAADSPETRLKSGR